MERCKRVIHFYDSVTKNTAILSVQGTNENISTKVKHALIHDGSKGFGKPHYKVNSASERFLTKN